MCYQCGEIFPDYTNPTEDDYDDIKDILNMIEEAVLQNQTEEIFDLSLETIEILIVLSSCEDERMNTLATDILKKIVEWFKHRPSGKLFQSTLEKLLREKTHEEKLLEEKSCKAETKSFTKFLKEGNLSNMFKFTVGTLVLGITLRAVIAITIGRFLS